MTEGYNLNDFNHTATAERVVNSQVAELKSDISNLTFEMENINQSTSDFTVGRVEELDYQINKLKSQLDRLTKE